MSTLTIRLPDEKHERLRELAKARNISLNKLMDELATRIFALLGRVRRGWPVEVCWSSLSPWVFILHRHYWAVPKIP